MKISLNFLFQLTGRAKGLLFLVLAGLALADWAQVAAAAPFPAPPLTRVPNRTLRMPSALLAPDAPIPGTLADTGAFADLRTLAPEAGIVPFNINVALWADGSHKKRWFSVPDTNLTIGFSRDGKWSFPVGTVWIKLFALDLTNGVSASARRLETRFLVRTTDGVYGVTYRWDDSQTNATLVPAQGLDEPFIIHEGNTTRTQTWRYPSRSECLRCHNPVAGYALGFNTAQLNCDIDYGDGSPRKQMRALSDAGFFTAPVTNLHTLPALAAATNTEVSLEHRVCSYLAANCAHCHQPGAQCSPASTSWSGLMSTPLSSANIINGQLSFRTFDAGLNSSNHRVITPGDPSHSMMLLRVAALGPDRMPPLATSLINTQALQLLAAWITNDLPHYQSYPNWQTERFGAGAPSDSAPGADPDNDSASNYLEYLTRTDPHSAAEAWKISLRRAGEGMEIRFPRIAQRGFDVEWTTDLAEPRSWTSLDVPGNQPFFPALTQEAVVKDADFSGGQRFYRVRVYEP